MRSFITAAFALAAGFAALVNGQPASGSYELPMKTLVVTTQSVLSDYPMWIMNAMQQPFDIVQVVNDGEKTPNANASALAGMLKDSNGNPNYNSIVLETLQLGYLADDGTFVSALQSETWTAIHQYCKQFDVCFLFPQKGNERKSTCRVSLAFTFAPRPSCNEFRSNNVPLRQLPFVIEYIASISVHGKLSKLSCFLSDPLLLIASRLSI